jgi:hypothetical protein
MPRLSPVPPICRSLASHFSRRRPLCHNSSMLQACFKSGVTAAELIAFAAAPAGQKGTKFRSATQTAIVLDIGYAQPRSDMQAPYATVSSTLTQENWLSRPERIIHSINCVAPLLGLTIWGPSSLICLVRSCTSTKLLAFRS